MIDQWGISVICVRSRPGLVGDPPPGPCPGGGPHPGGEGHGAEEPALLRVSGWLTLVLIAQDLTAWSQRLVLEGELAKAEPKRFRYALWHAAGRLVRSGRRTILRLAASWPWATILARAFRRVRALMRRL